MTESLSEELAALLNKYSRENGSNTPDYVLARYLLACLQAYDDAVDERERWHGRTPRECGDPADERGLEEG